MFNRLRNAMLWFNLSITVAVIAAAFVAIYWSTSSKVLADIASKLNMMPTVTFSLDEDGVVGRVDVEVSDSQVPIGSMVVQTSDMFSLDLDASGRIIAVHSTFGLSEQAYEQVARAALSQHNRQPISWQGRQWRYKIDTALSDYAEAASKITYLDVTDSYSSLARLRNTLWAVGGAVVSLLFVISYIFANRAIHPLREAWRKQKQFVSDASHELKTPLSIMNANLGVLLENRQETIDSQMKWLAYMQKGIDRMAYLIHELLRLARLEDQHQQPLLQAFDFSHMVSDVLTSFEAAIVAKKMTLTHNLTANIELKGDPAGIQHVLMILLDNAVKYGNDGGRVHVSLTKSRSNIHLEVANTGAGIPAGELLYVFDRFYRGDASRKHEEEGSFGLGLSIAKSLVEQAGGHISVRSEEGEWTSFTCVFSE